MNDSIRLNCVEYYGKVIKSGTRNFHPMKAYEGKRVIDVSKEPSDDSWAHWYLFESEMPLPVHREVKRLEYASFMDVEREDCGGPGQLFHSKALIFRMTPRRMLIVQTGGRDI